MDKPDEYEEPERESTLERWISRLMLATPVVMVALFVLTLAFGWEDLSFHFRFGVFALMAALVVTFFASAAILWMLERSRTERKELKLCTVPLILVVTIVLTAALEISGIDMLWSNRGVVALYQIPVAMIAVGLTLWTFDWLRKKDTDDGKDR